jgi:hypothetical protein
VHADITGKAIQVFHPLEKAVVAASVTPAGEVWVNNKTLNGAELCAYDVGCRPLKRVVNGSLFRGFVVTGPSKLVGNDLDRRGGDESRCQCGNYALI